MTSEVDLTPPGAPAGSDPMRIDPEAGEDELAAGVAMAGLAGMTPAMLRVLVMSHPLADTWERIMAGRPVPGFANGVDRMKRWAMQLTRLDPHAVLERHRSAGVGVHLIGHAGYPEILAGDPQAPAVLFTRGDRLLLEGRRVAIVGTRSCTRYGIGVAREFGADLAAAGVKVVSGLAAGIDAAAHWGALSGTPNSVIGVVAGGMDVVYPRVNAALWSQVDEQGLMLSEAPLGLAHQAWRFPWRNRVIAGLAEVLVVIESHGGGGSLLTVESAIRRSVPVMAVPGPIRSAASEGTNRLLRDGAIPALDATDVLVALGCCEPSHVSMAAKEPVRPPRRAAEALPGPIEGTSPTLGPTEKAVLSALEWEPTNLEAVLARTGMSLGRVAFALEMLEDKGLATSDGTWWELKA